MQTFQKPAFGGLALLMLAVVAMLALRALKPASAATPAALAAPSAAGALGAGVTARAASMPQALGPAAGMGAPALAIAAASPVPPTPPPEPSPIMLLRNEIAANVERDPDVAARLVRTWMRES